MSTLTIDPTAREVFDYGRIDRRGADAALGFKARHLGELFRLTPAELRLAATLAAGRSLSEFAAERAVSLNTARSQLAGVLRKTGAANQRELVRLIGLMPPVSSAPR